MALGGVPGWRRRGPRATSRASRPASIRDIVLSSRFGSGLPRSGARRRRALDRAGSAAIGGGGRSKARGVSGVSKGSKESGVDRATGSTSLDLAALRARYREEREKRLRADAANQYLEVAGIYSHFERDPWAEGELERAPVTDDVDVVLIGGGFGGLVTGARLRQSGIESLRVVEKGADFGGTWYWNRYPGVACDVESFCYLPLIEEVGTKPTEKYPPGAEIFEHCRALGRKFDLYRGALFRTEVKALAWDESASRWIVGTDRGDTLRARFVCLSVGFLEKPKLPGIPGIELFEGKSFHTSRWDYAYTGGDARGNLTGLRDKRVGVIGTGATAVQCVPHLGASAKQLFVFQRTPAGVGVRNNHPVDPDWAARLAPGWQKGRIENFQILTTGGYEEEDLVADSWTEVPKRVHEAVVAATAAKGGAPLSQTEMAAIAERIDHEAMEEVRARIARVVQDPATAEALKPYYRQFCKRPCYHDEYLPTFNRPNVKLVDTKGKGVERITKKGVVVDGCEIEVDCLIYATGFEVATEYVRRAGFETTGRGGLTLSEKWR
ncbi:NAD(P)/FAD-dependent oxidoreductase, partial [Myxococcota bacterium]|nr:NAD(P)/FAD-dependent oxidoreductase [Myxococcota bacterium]